MALVVGRWLLGFAFSKHDLELLDDPIPDTLYCKRCRQKDATKSKVTDPEGSSKDSESYDLEEYRNFPITVEPSGSNGSINIKSAPSKLNDSFNLTREVDKCDLWKNMVKNYDAPLLSPNVVHRSCPGEFTRETNGSGGKIWFTTDSDYRELEPLEECDTDLELCPISASADECRESDGQDRRVGRFFFNPRGSTSGRTSSPVISSGESRNSGRGHCDPADSDEGVASDWSKFRITSV